ncbi:MAG: GyrI-like domain-containing protein [Candidatus Helarchaeota archaeon]|nr:GyrI-like domain-containing protein [Candidatus Helarchaeota archaeon]
MSSEQIPIGRFSQITRLTQKALRIYDDRRILIPAVKDPMTGYRYYSSSQIERALKIKYLIEMGFSLTEINKLLMAMETTNHELIKQMFSEKLSDVKQEISRLKKIEEILLENTSIEVLFLSTSEPVIKKVSKMRVISKREKGPYGKTINRLIGEIMGQIFKPDNQRERVTIVGPPMYICHDKGYNDVDADIEIAVPITGRINVEKDFEVKYLPSGKVVSTIHTGSYSNLGEAYTRLFEYARKNGLKIGGLTREIYLTNPKEKPENELLTEIQLPID